MGFEGTDQYEIVRCIGAGGMGVVYEALDRATGTRVALKTLNVAEPQVIYRFKNEFRSLSHLEHRNLAGGRSFTPRRDEGPPSVAPTGS